MSGLYSFQNSFWVQELSHLESILYMLPTPAQLCSAANIVVNNIEENKNQRIELDFVGV